MLYEFAVDQSRVLWPVSTTIWLETSLFSIEKLMAKAMVERSAVKVKISVKIPTVPIDIQSAQKDPCCAFTGCGCCGGCDGATTMTTGPCVS
jgi:hypothetical protein